MTEIKGLNFSYLPNGNAQKLYQQAVTDAKQTQRSQQNHLVQPASRSRPRQAVIDTTVAPEVRVLTGDQRYLTEPGSIETISSARGTSAKATYCIEALKQMQRKFGATNLSPSSRQHGAGVSRAVDP